MKLHILSDLHLEFRPYSPKKVEADVVVVAGDVDLGVKGVEWLLENFPDLPVVYVMGNHEYYGHSLSVLHKALDRAEGTNVHLLERESVWIKGVEFLGTTMWTDFNLYGKPHPSMVYASRNMSDFSMIRKSSFDQAPFSPEKSVELNKIAVQWLRENLLLPSGHKRVVVTHHAPSSQSVARRFQGDPLSPAFASNFDALVRRSDLWIHGHVHDPFDYTSCLARVVCNPLGYPHELDNGFKHDLVIEI